jgi:TrmH family RNA methyltransferase
VAEPLSAKNPRIAHLRRLSGRRRSRAAEGLFLLEGPVVVAEALAGGAPFAEVFVDIAVLEASAPGSKVAAVVERAEEAGVAVRTVAAGVLATVTDTVTPQGVVGVVERRTATLERLVGDGLVLVLAGVADPGNAGTLVRTAEAAGALGVVFCDGSVDPFGPKVVRSAAGSLLRLPVAEASAGAATIAALVALCSGGRRLVATQARDGADPESVDLAAPVALVVGNEAHGLCPEVAALVDVAVTIPMAGPIESLNAAVAGAVVLFEAARQRRHRGDDGTGAATPVRSGEHTAKRLDVPAGSRQAQRR